MARTQKLGPVTIEANLTPLVDVVFLLIVFFVLVAQLTNAEHFELNLPTVQNAETIEIPADGKITISVIPRHMQGQLGGAYRVGVRTFAGSEPGIAALTDLIQTLRARDVDLVAVIRAARDERYQNVHPVIAACSLAGVMQVDLVTAPEAEELAP